MGGKNSRMGGYTKGLLKIHEVTFLDKILDVFEQDSKVYLSINNKFTEESKEEYRNKNLILVEDLYEEIGPLGGIYSALKNCEEDYLMVTACDMPLITKEYIDKMYSYLKDDVDVVICYDKEGRYYPLGAIYSKRIIPTIKSAIENKRYSVMGVVDKSNAVKVSVEELKIDTKILSNINTPSDYNNLLEDKTIV